MTHNTLRSKPEASTQRKKAGSPCRFCGQPLTHTFIGLGMSPLCQTHIAPEQLNSMEPFYPLHAYVCDRCLLVQLDEYVGPSEIFSEYAYFSSYSDSWVAHAKRYADDMCDLLELDEKNCVMEIASNDGYLLQHFSYFSPNTVEKVFAAHGLTLLNYCGIRTDFLDFTVDRNPYKQGKYTPGTHIPILAPEAIREARPDYIFILPWNLRDEIAGSLDYVHAWGCRLVVPIPKIEVLS